MKLTWGAASMHTREAASTWAWMSTWTGVMGDGPSTWPTKLPSSMAMQHEEAFICESRRLPPPPPSSSAWPIATTPSLMAAFKIFLLKVYNHVVIGSAVTKNSFLKIYN